MYTPKVEADTITSMSAVSVMIVEETLTLLQAKH